MKEYIVFHKFLPRDYFKMEYRGKGFNNWCTILAETPSKAKTIALKYSYNLRDSEYLELGVRKAYKDDWCYGEEPDRNGVMMDIEFDAYERQLEYDYSAHYG